MGFLAPDTNETMTAETESATMTQLDRRSLLKLLIGHAAAGVSLAVGSSCSDRGSFLSSSCGADILSCAGNMEGLDEAESSLSAADPKLLDEFESAVNFIVRADFAGGSLGGNPPRQVGRFLAIASDSGWDRARVASGFDVSRPTVQESALSVNVAFRLIGQITDHFLSQDGVVTHPYHLASRRGRLVIHYTHEPIVAKHVAISHLRRLLNQRFTVTSAMRVPQLCRSAFDAELGRLQTILDQLTAV